MKLHSIYETACHTLKDNMRSRVTARQAPMHSLLCHFLGQLAFKECYLTSLLQDPALSANPKIFFTWRNALKMRACHFEPANRVLSCQISRGKAFDFHYCWPGDGFTGAGSCTKKDHSWTKLQCGLTWGHPHKFTSVYNEQLPSIFAASRIRLLPDPAKIHLQKGKWQWFAMKLYLSDALVNQWCQYPCLMWPWDTVMIT